MINFDDLSLEVFQVLRTYANDIVLYDDSGNRVMEPSTARRFYLPDDGLLVTVLDDNDNSAIKVYLGGTITVAEVNDFVTVLRHLATQYNVLFNLRKYNKRIVPKDFATQAAVQEHTEQPENSNMNIMEGMYGTSRSSYLKLENARMIVRHSARVKENVIGSRGRSIQSIFVENALGERFLFPINILSGARAMTQHVNQGGTFADEVGQHIIKMAQDFSNLSTVANHIYAHHGDLPEQALTVRESIREAASSIKRTFERLSRDNASYIRESAKLKEGSMLAESDDYLEETVEELQNFLAVEGVTLSNSILESVCKLVKVEEDMRPTSNTPDTSSSDDQEAQQRLAQGQEQKPVGNTDTSDSEDDNEKSANSLGSGQNGAFHEDEDMEDGDDSEDLAENNPVIREFTAWLESFDEDTLAEGLIDQIPDDFEADEDWVYDNEDAITNELHSLVDKCDANPALLNSLKRSIMKGIRAMNLVGFEPMDLGFNPDSPTIQKLGILDDLDESSPGYIDVCEYWIVDPQMNMVAGGFEDRDIAMDTLVDALNAGKATEDENLTVVYGICGYDGKVEVQQDPLDESATSDMPTDADLGKTVYWNNGNDSGTLWEIHGNVAYVIDARGGSLSIGLQHLSLNDNSEIDEATTQDMSSRGSGDRQQAKEVLASVLRGEESVEIRGKELHVTGAVKSTQLQVGMNVLVSYSGHNQGVEAVHIDSFILNVNGGQVHANSLKELANYSGVKTLAELEKLGEVRLQVMDLESRDSGDWYYLFKGRFRRGSGAEALSFYTLQ